MVGGRRVEARSVHAGVRRARRQADAREGAGARQGPGDRARHRRLAGRDHLDIDALLDDKSRAGDYRKMIADAGLTISALSCHGNPLHPERADRARVRRRVPQDGPPRRAEWKCRSSSRSPGCPGDSEDAKHPNWVTTPWPPEFLEVLDWQWEKKAIPYWTEAATFAADHGVKVALEAHPGFLVYNVGDDAASCGRPPVRTSASISIRATSSGRAWTCRRRSARSATRSSTSTPRTSRSIGRTSRSTACSTPRPTGGWPTRSWLFRSVGWGHDELEWKRIVSALRLAGYDYVMSIEHEDALASVDEGLKAAVDLLSRVILTEPPVEAWWT